MTATEPIEINEVFELAFRFVTETNENIFLTGKAGTGKTTFLKYLKEHCTKNIVVAAPTGVAAINAGGVTLHSLFQLPFHPFLPTAISKNELLQKLRFTRRRIDLLRKMDVLVIDEISMVRCDVLDAVDTILRHVRRRHDIPFGGTQVLFIGDLYQLPPVARQQDWMLLHDYYNSEFFFDSQVLRNDMPVLIELQKIFRQQNDSFISILNKVRNNEMMTEDFEELHERYLPGFSPSADEKYITLTSHNYQADKINNSELAQLQGAKSVFKAEVKNDFPETMFPAEEILELKIGAQVMFLKNDPEKKYFNGKIGVIKSLSEEEITIESDGKLIDVQPETWENVRYTVNRNDGRLDQEVMGTFTQFPLRLAWAITIHKSQGLTFDRVMIDAGSAFSSGQVYVALSRCRSLEGIVLLSRIPPHAILCNESVVQNHHSMASGVSLPERFESARKAYTMQLLDETFSFDRCDDALKVLEYRIREHSEKITGDPGTWLLETRRNFDEAKAIGEKFVRYTFSLMQEEPVIEKNSKLQQRITDAAGHFIPQLTALKKSVQNHPLSTEHREVSQSVDEFLNQLLDELTHQIYLLEFCRKPFSIAGILQHRLKSNPAKSSATVYAGKQSRFVSDTPNAELYETLRRWRDITCQDYDLPIYMVANQTSLKELSTYLPLTRKDLMKISGFGKAKAERYGDEILDIVIDYCRKHNLQTNMESLPSNPKKEKKPAADKTPSHEISYNLFKEGKSIDEIAAERKLTFSTIEGHLSRYVGNGTIPIDQLVSKHNQNLIIGAAAIHGWESMGDLKNNLPREITFGQLRMVKASIADESDPA